MWVTKGDWVSCPVCKARAKKPRSPACKCKQTSVASASPRDKQISELERAFADSLRAKRDMRRLFQFARTAASQEFPEDARDAAKEVLILRARLAAIDVAIKCLRAESEISLQVEQNRALIEASEIARTSGILDESDSTL